MLTTSRTSSDSPVDIEKGFAGTKAAAIEEGEQPAVVDSCAMNPREAMCIKVSLDVCAVLFVFYCISLITWMVMHSKNWWDPWPVALVLSINLVWALWMAPKMKYDTKSTRGSDDDSHLSTRLLAS